MSRFTVTSAGGVLRLPEVGVTLVVPETAIRANHTAEIILGLSYNPADTPLPTSTTIPLTPPVLCAINPSSIQFSRPALLAFSHCGGKAVLSKTKGTTKFLQSFTDVSHPTHWTEFTGLEDEEEMEFGAVTETQGVVFIAQPRLFTMVMEPHLQIDPTKSVRLTLFLSYSAGGDSVAVHVYSTDNLPSEIKVKPVDCLTNSDRLSEEWCDVRSDSPLLLVTPPVFS